MKRNKYPSGCSVCYETVGPGEGFLRGKDESSGAWIIVCEACDRAESSSSATAASHAREQLRDALRNRSYARARAEAEREARAEAARERERFYDDLRRRIFEMAYPSGPSCLEILGLKPPVTSDIVKARFRELAKQNHPDRGGDPKKFIAIESAYREALVITGGSR